MGKQYIDATIFVYASRAGPHREGAVAALRTAIEQGAATLAMTFDEVTWALREEGLQAAAAHAKRFLALKHLEIVPAAKARCSQALELINQHGLKPRDAFHAAACISSGLTLLSADSDFDKIPDIDRAGPP